MKDKLASLLIAIWLLALASLFVGWLGRFHFLFDLASHFRIEQVLAIVVCGFGLLCLKRKRSGGIAIGTGLLFGGMLLPYFWPHLTSGYNAQKLHSLTTINVLTSNRDIGAVVDYVRQVDSDVVVFQETNQAWIDSMEKALTKDYPYRQLVPREDNFGIALLSKVPLANVRVTSFSPSFDLPSIVADVQFDDLTIHLVATHPLPPVGTANWKDRNGLFEAVAKHVRHGDPAKTIVAGDLNCTPWSHWFGRLLSQSKLRDSSVGNGVGDTWSPFSVPLLGLPIDHVLVGADLQVIHRTVGPNVGSDHRGVTVTFR